MKVEFHGAKVACDAGLLAHRKLDRILGFTTVLELSLLTIEQEKMPSEASSATETFVAPMTGGDSDGRIVTRDVQYLQPKEDVAIAAGLKGGKMSLTRITWEISIGTTHKDLAMQKANYSFFPKAQILTKLVKKRLIKWRLYLTIDLENV